MKYKNYNDKEDNYIDMKKKVFVFNKFKTKSSKGQQVLEIPKLLYPIMKKWISIIPDDMDFLLFDSKGQELTPSQMTHRLNNIFKKPISTSMLRHIYLTSKFSNVNLQDLTNTAHEMGNSPLQALQYVKK
jgi:integrase